MDPSENDKLTPAQEREARRKLRRIVGDGTPEEQVARVFEQVFQHAAKRRSRAAIRTLVNSFGRIILNALENRRKQ